MKLLTLVILSSVIAVGVQAESYSPASFSLFEGFEVMPQYKTSVYYDDNIYTSESDAVSSFIVVNQPSIQFGVSDGINRYGGRYVLTSGVYSEVNDGDDNYLDHAFSLTTYTEFTDRNKFDFDLSFSRTHEDRGSNSTDSAAYTYDEPLIYHNYKANTYYEFGAQSAMFNVGGGVQYTQKRYQNSTDTTQYDDTEKIKFLLDGSYRIGGVTYLTIGMTHLDTQYLTKEESVASQDSKDNNFYLGMRWNGLGKTVGTVKLGYQYKTFDDSSREDFNGNTIDLSFTWSPLTYSDIKLDITREAQDSSSYGDYILVLGSDLTWTHNWSDILSTVSQLGYDSDDYIGSSSDRKDKTLSASFDVSYSFSRWVLLSTGVGYTNRDSSLYGYGYEQSTVNLGIKISL